MAPQKGSFRHPLVGFFGNNPQGFFERGFFERTLKISMRLLIVHRLIITNNSQDSTTRKQLLAGYGHRSIVFVTISRHNIGYTSTRNHPVLIIWCVAK